MTDSKEQPKLYAGGNPVKLVDSGEGQYRSISEQPDDCGLVMAAFKTIRSCVETYLSESTAHGLINDLDRVEEALSRPAREKVNQWLPMSTAPKDCTRVLLKFKDDLTKYEGSIAGSLERFQGIPFVGRNRGDLMEWAFAAPVGHGGFPDAWLEGWKPISNEIEGETP